MLYYTGEPKKFEQPPRIWQPSWWDVLLIIFVYPILLFITWLIEKVKD